MIRYHSQATHVGSSCATALRRLCALLALCLCLPVASQPSLGTPAADPFAQITQPAFLRVEEAYPLIVDVTGERSLRLLWQMPPGYYLYQHAFRFGLSGAGQDLEPVASLPPALTREDEFFGRVQVYYDIADITLDSELAVAGTVLSVTSQGCADAGLCYPPRTQRFEISERGEVSEIAGIAPRRDARPVTATGAASGGLLLMALLAFAGGLVLNLMPCVLPILSLKALSFANCEPMARHRHGWYYSAGVVSSFVVVGALLMILRGAGQAVGWGFQLQSPGFVIALAYLFTVMGLSLSGLVNVGANLMNVGAGLAARDGGRGSFFTGVLAVIVASPCTAPFMGTALGFALTQSPAPAIAVFAALGAGMATPLLLLSYSETARRRLPRPGAWMDKLKQALAFPLYATALWLFWVVGRQGGVDLMAAALLGALLLALALWLWNGRIIARGFAVLCIFSAVAVTLWRPGSAETHLPPGSVAYSPEQLEQYLLEGRAVFVDVTADWCITCLANEKAVLGNDTVQAAFAANAVTYMVADWTDYDPQIADFVASHGRSGIPLYVLYDGNPGSVPRVLPQLLRTSTVIDALKSTGDRGQAH